MKEVKIIGISGYAGSGKDTFAQFLIKHSSRQWEVKKYAYKLKLIASILTGIPVQDFEKQEFKNSNLPEEWDIEVEDHPGTAPANYSYGVREFLQYLGTDAVRDNLHPQAWVNALWADYRRKLIGFDDEGDPVRDFPNWIITDMRFPNEMKAIKDRGGMTIKIMRSGAKPSNNHISDTALEEAEFDTYIRNYSTLSELEESAIHLVKEYNL